LEIARLPDCHFTKLAFWVQALRTHFITPHLNTQRGRTRTPSAI
jgi:hypothetical protein